MYKTLCTLLFVAAFQLVWFSPPSAVAESNAFSCKAGTTLGAAEGAKVLDQNQRRYASLKTLHGRFLQDSYLAALEISESSSGLMWFSKPGLMKWHYTDPEPQDFIVRDHTYWLYQEQEKQVVIDQFSKILISDLPIAFIMGIGSLTKDFTIKSGCRTVQGNHYLLDLIPRTRSDEGKDDLSGFILLIDPATSLPAGAQITDIGGNVTRMVFSKLEADKELDPHLFEPTFPEGIDINDRREERIGR